jgi:hypothetical protein
VEDRERSFAIVNGITSRVPHMREKTWRRFAHPRLVSASTAGRQGASRRSWGGRTRH